MMKEHIASNVCSPLPLIIFMYTSKMKLRPFILILAYHHVTDPTVHAYAPTQVTTGSTTYVYQTQVNNFSLAQAVVSSQ